jgi:NAD(P)-dependent dehydrogenase (short-subunit alcohol dehydrogenase family)
VSQQAPGTALVIGGTGGLGSAFAMQLRLDSRYTQVLSTSRHPAGANEYLLDYARESTLADCAQWVTEKCSASPLRTVIVATGYLHGEAGQPERSASQMNANYLQQTMLINAIGPALAIKHFMPLLSREQVTRWAMISAKVGSIGDNALGGWYGYRASKAALNQIVKTASIEMTRRNKLAICVALHPGTVATSLSEPFSKAGLNVRSPEVAAGELINVLHSLESSATGGFFDYMGETLPW